MPYRSAKNGRYITKAQANRKPSQSVKETDKKKKQALGRQRPRAFPDPSGVSGPLVAW